MTRYVLALMVIAVLAVLYLRGELIGANARAGAAETKLQDANQALANIGVTRALEHAAAGEMAAIGDDHEENRTDAAGVPAAVVADLRDGHLQLRKQWAACETNRVSESAAATFERDALAELRRQDQGDLVRIGRDADDHVTACQAVIGTYRSAW